MIDTCNFWSSLRQLSVKSESSLILTKFKRERNKKDWLIIRLACVLYNKALVIKKGNIRV